MYVAKVAFKLTTCPYFDNPKFSIFYAVVISVHILHLYFMLVDFHKSTNTLVKRKAFTSFLISSFVPLALADEITLTVWLKVPNTETVVTTAV